MKRASATLLCAIVAAVLSLASSSPAQEDIAGARQTVFFRANAYYHDGAYEQAVQSYEQLLGSGLESGNLRFNLGNAYFKLGDIGRAIANYERAHRFMPADPDLTANLTYARSLTGAERCAMPLWQRALLPLRGQMSSASLAWLFTAFWTLAFAMLIAQRMVSMPLRFLTYAAAGFAGLALICGVSLGGQLLLDEWPSHAVVVGVGETAARFEPADDGTIHFSLPEGSRVRITEEREGWLQIARCDGRRGWVPAGVLERL